MYECEDGSKYDCRKCPFFIENEEYCALYDDYIDPKVRRKRETPVRVVKDYDKLFREF